MSDFSLFIMQNWEGWIVSARKRFEDLEMDAGLLCLDIAADNLHEYIGPEKKKTGKSWEILSKKFHKFKISHDHVFAFKKTQ